MPEPAKPEHNRNFVNMTIKSFDKDFICCVIFAGPPFLAHTYEAWEPCHQSAAAATKSANLSLLLSYAQSSKIGKCCNK